MSPTMEETLAVEHNWARAGEKLAVANMNEKLIEEKERLLQNSIARNYERIRDVEKELLGLQLQLKLTSGPKKSALEMLRKKIEAQTDVVIAARGRFHEARKVMEAAQEALAAEERAKEQLCQELNLLVQQSAHAQLDKLEQLTQRLESLQGGMAGPVDNHLQSSAAELQQQIQSVAGQVMKGVGAPAPAAPARSPRRPTVAPAEASEGSPPAAEPLSAEGSEAPLSTAPQTPSASPRGTKAAVAAGAKPTRSPSVRAHAGEDASTARAASAGRATLARQQSGDSDKGLPPRRQLSGDPDPRAAAAADAARARHVSLRGTAVRQQAVRGATAGGSSNVGVREAAAAGPFRGFNT